MAFSTGTSVNLLVRPFSPPIDSPCGLLTLSLCSLSQVPQGKLLQARRIVQAGH
jgi:hypothetical protein